MPPVEPRELQVIFGRDGRGVEGTVMRVVEAEVLETFVVFYEAVADDLYLWLVGDCLEVGV